MKTTYFMYHTPMNTSDSLDLNIFYSLNTEVAFLEKSKSWLSTFCSKKVFAPYFFRENLRPLFFLDINILVPNYFFKSSPQFIYFSRKKSLPPVDSLCPGTP